jgi:hypothetical protein
VSFIDKAKPPMSRWYKSGMEMYHVQPPVKYKILDSLSVSSSQLTLGKTIGQGRVTGIEVFLTLCMCNEGEFGIVYKGILKKSNVRSQVAVKTLKGSVVASYCNHGDY